MIMSTSAPAFLTWMQDGRQSSSTSSFMPPLTDAHPMMIHGIVPSWKRDCRVCMARKMKNGIVRTYVGVHVLRAYITWSLVRSRLPET